MKILILSDSHSKPINLNFDNYDYIIHAGDMGVSKDLITSLDNCYYVRGNCDFDGDKIKQFELMGYQFFLTHGDLFNVKYDLDRLITRGLIEEANLVIFGHTHIPYIYQEGNTYFLNPGAYMNDYYVELIDNTIYMYQNNKCYKKIKME